MNYPKIGIRPAIDGRWGGVRESLEAQPMSMTLTAHRTIPSQRRWVWKSEKPFNLPGTILEKCGQSFSICLAWIIISCPLMNRKHSKRFCQNRPLSKTVRSTSDLSLIHI